MNFSSAATTILVGILLWLTAHGQQPKLSDRIKENIISEVFVPDPGLAASAIRLSFHDCVGDDGCDGCIDFGQAANTGLGRINDRMEKNYLRNQGTIGNVPPWNVNHVSRADWWAVSSIAAVDFLLNKSSIHQGQGPRIVNGNCPPNAADNFFAHLCNSKSTMKFSSGRKDKSREQCDRLETESFPINVETLVKIFEETGLTETDAVALLGAHTVGKVGGFDFLKPMDSNGSLVNHHHHWDNMYYKILSEDMTWHSINHKPLSVAFGLKDKNGDGILTINSEEHVATLTLTADLDTVDTHPHLIFDYANDQEKWLQEYDRAYEKILAKGGRGGQNPQSSRVQKEGNVTSPPEEETVEVAWT